MEWRIILPLLYLIGILHLPGFVVSQSDTATTTTTTATSTTSASTATTTTTPTTATTTTTPTTAASTTPTTATTTTTPTTATTATTPTTATTATTHSTASGATTASTASGATTASTASGATTASTASGATTASTASGATTASTASGATTASTASGATSASTATGSSSNSTASGSSSNSTGGGSTAATTQTTTGPLPPFLGVLNLSFKINDTFQTVYSNLTDPTTISYVTNLKNKLNPVYKSSYTNYYGLVVNSLSSGSVLANTSLQFDTSNSKAPNATAVIETLAQAIISGGLGLSIDNTSITSVVVSSNASSTTASSIATTQTTTVATTALALANYNITFKMLGVFFSDLSNLNSNAGSLLALAVNSQLTAFFSNFRGFNQASVWRFRNGSIIVDALLAYIKNINAPNATDLAKQFGAAIRNQTVLLPIDPASINVTDFTGFTANKSSVLVSMLTALWMTLASLLFSAVMH